jgi:hypothetical protein
MCQRAVCSSCRMATFTGCGRHVEQVLAGVPAIQRCQCQPTPAASGRNLPGGR